MHFEDRTRILKGGPETGDYILYWMRTAVRVDHNPALITALELAQQFDKPVLVYHAVSERYPYASDRHHTFIIEGAMDVAKDMKRFNIPYFFHVEREGHRGAHLDSLASDAVCIVTEDMPIPFLGHWTERLAERTHKTVYLVDTDCIVPMKLSRKAPTSAFQFRDRFAETRQHRLEYTTFPDISSLWSNRSNWTPSLPFEPVDLDNCVISELLKGCAIDHSVLPVPHTKGGCTQAQHRWKSFKHKGLSQYHKRRNDPLKKGVSRMSAYLHYGMISSFQLARESMEYGAGGEKYRDELLIWRELAHHWCFHTPQPQHWMSLPKWARDTLEAHQHDTRAETYSWQQLRWAQTDDELWNLCQQSLNLQGELHNNVRMTWGKQLIEWFDNPRKALRMTLDLNNRLSLDGRDPSSYGGILWCFGLFDRPFKPEQSVWGTIRERTSQVHARRLSVEAYHKVVHTPVYQPSTCTINCHPFVACLLQQSLQDYNVHIVVDKDSTTFSIPTTFDDSHASKLQVASWIDAGWLLRTDSLSWTPEGQNHWQTLWKNIPQDTTNIQENCIQIEGSSHNLTQDNPLGQFQEAVQWISTQLKPTRPQRPAQIQIWGD